jgi:amphi-Trp domain-containing protein
MSEKPDRDVEKIYSASEFVAKLRRLADALEAGERFEIQVAGERVYVPARAEFNVEHEREGDEEVIESNSSGPTPPLPVPTRHADSQIPRERHGRRSLLAIAERFRSSMRGRVGIWHGAHCTSEYELP